MKVWPSPDGDDEPEWTIRLEFAFLAAITAFGVMLAVYGLLRAEPASAHPGGLAADGCHNDRKNGGRHCHRSPSSSHSTPQRAIGGTSAYFRNCSEARAAGAAPVRRGDPGYAAHLDRDNDGIGCE